MLKGKTVVLGVSGSIAAYKIANLASALVKLNADVHVIMTKNATNFINPITFETLTKNKCLVDTFDRNFEFKVEHVSLAQKADCMMIAPATANVIAKLRCGIADDMLTTTALACDAPIIVSPAMNTHMYEKKVTRDNISALKEYGFEIIEPANGYLACGDVGAGKMPEPEVLLEYILKAILREKDLEGKKVLISAGPTREAIDPVRFISNHSTGKMGYALAKEASYRGAKVVLVSGPVDLDPPLFAETVNVTSAKEMYDEIHKHFSDTDIVIKAAAVADYRPKSVAENKIKKSAEESAIELERTDDIIASLGKIKRDNQFVCGFSMETENMLENSRAKLKKKNIDMIVANNLRTKGAGFGTSTNVVTIIKEGSEKELPLMSKDEVSHEIFNEIIKEMK
ncbi:MAG: bifunctional phosphopantothenoylcysteine decarboxylase/phosphopantothenate--cysteine ligase CoaBC [Eubacterium sp.]|nr:bifunctional phosphopantothenoylcysteine decarboxylase/phosphopantothenate--cysteine ligase CoaBC [Eubacterium sp.]